VCALDLVYVIAGFVVPAATVLGLRIWFVRSRAAGPPDSAGDSVADRENADLARSVADVQERLAELTGQLETMSRDWRERDRRLTTQLNSLLALTERPRRFDLFAGDAGDVGGDSAGGRAGARRSSRQ
jgi:hypothetical protein